MSEATRARLARLLEDEDGIDLAEANLLIASEARPDLDLAGVLGRVDALADRAREGGVVAALRAEGLAGDRDSYDEPANSFLDQVLARRRGLPIALATLTLAVAARVGAPMAGVGLPGHFVVSDGSGPERVIRDPFDSWRVLSLEDCARLVRRVAGVALTPSHLAPVPPREILARTLRNLRGAYLRRRRPSDALWTVELGEIIAPGEPVAGPDRVALLMAAGRYDAAVATARERLRADPPPRERAELRARLAAARELRRRMS